MDARVFAAAERLGATYSKQPRQTVTVTATVTAHRSERAEAEAAATTDDHQANWGMRFNFRAPKGRLPRTRTRRNAINNPSPGGPVVDALMEQASACNEPMHAAMSAWVELLGGRYDKGPLKTVDRVLEKTYTDYAGDPLRVVDIVRGTAVFVTLAQLAFALESLFDMSCDLVVVRAKDRINKPTSFGYSDMLLK